MFVVAVYIVAVVATVIVYLRQIYSTFSKYDVKHLTPVPVVGNTAQIYFGLEHFVDGIRALLNQERSVGRFEFTNKLVVIQMRKVVSTDIEYSDFSSHFNESNFAFCSHWFALTGTKLDSCEVTAITYELVVCGEMLPNVTTCVAILCPSSVSQKLCSGISLDPELYNQRVLNIIDSRMYYVLTFDVT